MKAFSETWSGPQINFWDPMPAYVQPSWVSKALARSLWKDTAELWFSTAHCSCTGWWEVYYQTDRGLKITEYYSQAPKHPHDSGPEDVWGLDLKHKKNSITKHKKNTNEPETRDEDRETHTHTLLSLWEIRPGEQHKLWHFLKDQKDSWMTAISEE